MVSPLENSHTLEKLWHKLEAIQEFLRKMKEAIEFE